MTFEVSNPTAWVTGSDSLVHIYWTLKQHPESNSHNVVFTFHANRVHKEQTCREPQRTIVHKCFIVNDINIKIFLVYPCFVFLKV